MRPISPSTLVGAIANSMLLDFLLEPEATNFLVFHYLPDEYMIEVNSDFRPEYIEGTAVPNCICCTQVDALFRIHLKNGDFGFVYVLVNEEHRPEDVMTEMLIRNLKALFGSAYASPIWRDGTLSRLHQIVVCPSDDDEGIDITVTEVLRLPDDCCPQTVN